MCYFITLVVRGADDATIAKIADRYGRRAKRIDNRSVATALAEDEAQYLTTVGHCDCGTALAPKASHVAGRRAEQALKLAKEGWSLAKIERWLSDREKADNRAEGRTHANTSDSIELWSKIVHDIVLTPGVEEAGLLLHYYSGSVETEVFWPTREKISIHQFAACLTNMRENELLMARRA